MRVVIMALLAVMCSGEQVLSGEGGDLTIEMTELLLDGRSLPTDIYLRVIALPPIERFEAVVFLRRSGMLTGPTWPVDELLEAAPRPLSER